MKKIGLAVCYDTKNFGSQLQVLATVKSIEKLGYSTEIIRYRKRLTPTFLMQTLPRLFNLSFIKSKIKSSDRDRGLKKHQEWQKKIEIRNKRFDEFIKYFFTNLSVTYDGWEQLVKKCKSNYDVFLCGSDQLWLPNNLGSHFYTLEFAPDDKKKIAYATSFGVSEIPIFQRKNTARYLNRFQSLSTREISGAKIIKELICRNVPVVCDPTMLLTAQEWDKIIAQKRVIEEKYIFCYFLGSNAEHREIAEEFAKKKEFKVVTVPFLDNYVEKDLTFGDYQLYDVDSSDFVNLIRYAEYILTDSFHGSVFSILNRKKFMVFNRFSQNANSRNSRIDSLCELLDLDSRRYHGCVDDIIESIDYDKVQLRLAKIRDESIEYLSEALYQC